MLNLIMTTRTPRGEYTIRFLQSLLSQKADVKKQMRLYAILQSPDELPVELDDIETIKIHIEPCSLSKARNIGLSYLPEEAGIVAFPDDDCWYNDTVVSVVLAHFEKNDYDFLSTGVFDPIKNRGFGRHRTLNEKCELDEKNIIFKPLSISIFYKYKNKSEIPLFDEMFGVGTEWGSGEETDWLLNLLHNKKKGFYDSVDCVYHETDREKDFDLKSLFRYSKGFAAMMIKSRKVRKQKDVYKQFKKLIMRTKLARIYYLFDKKKRSVYVARMKGFKAGIKEGKNFYKREI